MKNCDSPAVDALENDFDAFFEYLISEGEAPQIGGMGGVPPMERSETFSVRTSGEVGRERGTVAPLVPCSRLDGLAACAGVMEVRQ